MSQISFHKQPLIDGFLPLHIRASNGDFSGSTEANVYPDEFKYFARKLISFQHEPGDQVVFSSGGDDEMWASYLYLGVYYLETNRQPALQIRLRRNEPEIQSGGAAFIIPTDGKKINQLGERLVEWLGSANEEMCFEF